MQTEEIQQRIEKQLPGAKVAVIDMTGTGDHFEAIVESDLFRGKPLVARHQMIYALFPEELKTERIHAFKLTTRAPGEA